MEWIFIIFVLFVLYLGFLSIRSKFSSTAAIPIINIESKSQHFWQEKGNARVDFEVVGESFYQSNIASISINSDLIAHLIPENDNKYDSLAIRVDIERKTVGYLSKEDARAFRKKLKRLKLDNATTACNAYVTGGHLRDGKQMNYGVEINLAE